LYKTNSFVGAGAQNVVVQILNVSDMSVYKSITSTYAATVAGSAVMHGDGNLLVMSYIRSSDLKLVVELFNINTSTQTEEYLSVGAFVTKVVGIFMSNFRVVLLHSDGMSFFDGDLNFEGGDIDFGTYIPEPVSINGYGNNMVVSGIDSSGDKVVAIYNLDASVHKFLPSYDFATLGFNDIGGIACNDDYMGILCQNASLHLYLVVAPISGRPSIAEILITNKGDLDDTKPTIQMNEKYIFVSWYDKDVGIYSNHIDVYDMRGKLVVRKENIFDTASGNHVRGMCIDPYNVYMVSGNQLFVAVLSTGRRSSFFRHEPTGLQDTYYKWSARPIGSY
jgi:hypothetical protein